MALPEGQTATPLASPDATVTMAFMAERGTRQVLLRLRRAQEVESRRALTVLHAARTEARRACAAAEATRRALERKIAAQTARRGAWDGPRPAGRLVHGEAFEQGLRAAFLRARTAERRAAVALDHAEARLKDAQGALTDAVRARQRSESFAATERAQAARVRERREHAEVEDRYRGRPTRSR